MIKRYYGEPTVAFASDVDHLPTELVMPPQVLGQDDDPAEVATYAIEFYVADRRPGRVGDGPSVVLNASTARQLAAELLNRADEVDEFVAAMSR